MKPKVVRIAEVQARYGRDPRAFLTHYLRHFPAAAKQCLVITESHPDPAIGGNARYSIKTNGMSRMEMLYLLEIAKKDLLEDV